LTNDRPHDAKTILETWLARSGQGADDIDYGPCNEALVLHQELGLSGGIYYADGIPAGFIIGDELDAATFALHFVKADRSFKGIYWRAA
jgi:uncharacterized protein